MDSSVVRSNGNSMPDEESPLLPKPNSPSVLAKCRRYMGHDVRRSWADFVLLLCYVITGLLDSSSIQAWGSFVSMQTGASKLSSPTLTSSARDL